MQAQDRKDVIRVDAGKCLKKARSENDHHRSHIDTIRVFIHFENREHCGRACVEDMVEVWALKNVGEKTDSVRISLIGGADT